MERCGQRQKATVAWSGPKARQHHLELSSEQKVLGHQATAEQRRFNVDIHLMG